MIEKGERPQSQAVKTCCADLYSHEGIRLLLGEALHPGGLALTSRLAELLKLKRGDRVLDLAAGYGSSALHLAGTLGCRVEALDLARRSLTHARRNALEVGLEIYCISGDADALPFRNGAFDALIAECAFSTFPEKKNAAREIFRVLSPGGRLGVADITVEPQALPEALQGLFMSAACLADARSAEHYREFFSESGFERLSIEEHTEALSALLREVRMRLVLGRLASLAGAIDGVDLGSVESIVTQVERLVRDGTIGYILLTGERSDGI